MKYACIIASLLLAQPVMAETAHIDHAVDHESREQHMEIAPPQDSAAAITMLKEHSALMRAGWEEENLDKVHIQSYYLEAALSRLEEDAANNGEEARGAQLSDIQTLNFKVHHAAEDGEPEIVAEKLPQLLDGVEKLL